MEIHYQPANCKSFIKLIVLSLFLLCVSVSQSWAYDDLFKVDGVMVDVTAENAVAARDQAFAKAQTDAFAILSERMVQDAQGKEVKTPDPVTISTMIQDFEVANEQVSGVRYIGTYTFRFDSAAVSQYFSVSGVTFADKSAPPMLVLPFYQENGQISLWSETNIWLSAWAGAALKRGVVPVAVPMGDLMDVGDVDDAQALNLDQQGLGRILARYEASDAALMIAVPDVALSSVATGTEIAKGSMRVSLYSTDSGQPLHIQDFNFSADGKKTRDEFFTDAVQTLYAAFQKDWKSAAQDTVPAADTQAYIVSAEFEKLAEWVKIQKALKSVIGLSGVQIGSLKKNSARVAFSFAGDENMLRQVLAQNNLDLSDFVLNHAEQEAGNPIYTLRYTEFKIQPLSEDTQSEPVDSALPEQVQPEQQDAKGFYRPPPAEGHVLPDQGVIMQQSIEEELPAPPMEDIPQMPDAQQEADDFGVKTF